MTVHTHEIEVYLRNVHSKTYIAQYHYSVPITSLLAFQQPCCI